MIAMLLAAAALAGQGDVAGTWRTPTRGGIVEITHCGASICGRLVSSENLRTNPGLKDLNNKDASQRGRGLKGLQIIGGFGGGPREWTGGSVYDPEGGGTYHAKVTLVAPDQLKLQGCIVAPFCKTQTWTRAR